jgi:hypothetical protein
METREIPRADWAQFLDAFSRRHEGWLATLRILGDLGAAVEADSLPLEGVTVDGKRGGAIAVALGRSPTDRVEHLVPSPTRVLIEEADRAELALEIESRDGEKALLTFLKSVPTEMVDGDVRPAGGKGLGKFSGKREP